jgi:ferritin-like metal-binding protein YciE
MKIQNLDDVLTDELKDIYSLEQQLIKALAKMAKAADGELRTAFEEHLEQTRTHADRIQQICDQLKISPDGKKCAGIEGIVKEGNEVIKAGANPDSLNAALIGTAQRAEHYEIAAYGTARTHARQLGYISMVKLLNETLEEEKQTDRRLTNLAENSINVRAAMEKGNLGAEGNLQM